MTTVSVDGRNLSNVVLTLQPGMTVAGRVLFEGTTQQPPADFSRARVNLSPMDVSSGVARAFASSASGRVDANGRFTIAGVMPGKYRLTGSGGGTGWFLEASTIDGQNTLDFPAEVKPGQSVTGAVVTFTDCQAELSGTITNERGQPAPDYTVVVYPADTRYRVSNSMRIRTTRPATDGRFVFTGLPPGEYRLAPIFDLEPGSAYDPAFLHSSTPAPSASRLGTARRRCRACASRPACPERAHDYASRRAERDAPHRGAQSSASLRAPAYTGCGASHIWRSSHSPSPATSRNPLTSLRASSFELA